MPAALATPVRLPTATPPLTPGLPTASCHECCYQRVGMASRESRSDMLLKTQASRMPAAVSMRLWLELRAQRRDVPVGRRWFEFRVLPAPVRCTISPPQARCSRPRRSIVLPRRVLKFFTRATAQPAAAPAELGAQKCKRVRRVRMFRAGVPLTVAMDVRNAGRDTPYATPARCRRP